MDRSVSDTMGLRERMNRCWNYTMGQRISTDTGSNYTWYLGIIKQDG